MSRSQHTEAQIIGASKQMEAGRKAEDVARVFKDTIYAWKVKYGGMDVSQGVASHAPTREGRNNSGGTYHAHVRNEVVSGCIDEF